MMGGGNPASYGRGGPAPYGGPARGVTDSVHGAGGFNGYCKLPRNNV